MHFSILVLRDMHRAVIVERYEDRDDAAHAVARLERDGTLRVQGNIQTLDHFVTIMSTPGSYRRQEDYPDYAKQAHEGEAELQAGR